MSTSEARLDGNAIGGLLQELFGAEMTAAVSVCGSCGNRGPVADVHVYVRAPGTVVRCAACENVLLCVVDTPERRFVTFGRLTLQIAATEGRD